MRRAVAALLALSALGAGAQFTRGVREDDASSAPALALLLNGPTPAQIGAGTLSGSRGETVTTTRASTKTCATSASTVVTLAVNQPCVESAGLLVEAAHTNLLLRSQEFDSASWSKIGNTANPTVTANDTTAPDGTSTAERFTAKQDIALGAGSYTILYQQRSTTIGATYTATIWVKNGNATANPKIHLNDIGGAGGLTATECVLTTSWRPCTVTRTVTTITNNVSFGWYDQVAAITDQYVYVWGYMFEAGGYAHSYVATAGTTATGAADVVRLPASPAVATGTVDLDFVPLWTTVPGDMYLLDTLNTSTARNGVSLFARVTGPGRLRLDTTNAAGTLHQLLSGALSWVAGQRYRIRLKWGVGNKYLYRDGALVASLVDGSAPMPEAGNVVTVGNAYYGTLPADGYFSNLRVYRR
jgi:hypothetical protein